jgi:hypothetical protein
MEAALKEFGRQSPLKKSNSKRLTTLNDQKHDAADDGFRGFLQQVTLSFNQKEKESNDGGGQRQRRRQ